MKRGLIALAIVLLVVYVVTLLYARAKFPGLFPAR